MSSIPPQTNLDIFCLLFPSLYLGGLCSSPGHHPRSTTWKVETLVAPIQQSHQPFRSVRVNSSKVKVQGKILWRVKRQSVGGRGKQHMLVEANQAAGTRELHSTHAKNRRGDGRDPLWQEEEGPPPPGSLAVPAELPPPSSYHLQHPLLLPPAAVPTSSRPPDTLLTTLPLPFAQCPVRLKHLQNQLREIPHYFPFIFPNSFTRQSSALMALPQSKQPRW